MIHEIQSIIIYIFMYKRLVRHYWKFYFFEQKVAFYNSLNFKVLYIYV